jgi:hypothetical protein
VDVHSILVFVGSQNFVSLIRPTTFVYKTFTVWAFDFDLQVQVVSQKKKQDVDVKKKLLLSILIFEHATGLQLKKGSSVGKLIQVLWINQLVQQVYNFISYPFN